ncbi:hypothetical protein RR46_01748 [Papilio xuthus]|uniref:Uncharacterized protein n=1 Tax=Papilio xuthus TaxID=66420 RepID=A0A194QG39_PAPXU|nr:hypothetical protein RR46_01748 [Papilio xuthus]
MWWILRRAGLTGASFFSQSSGTNNNNAVKTAESESSLQVGILGSEPPCCDSNGAFSDAWGGGDLLSGIFVVKYQKHCSK